MGLAVALVLLDWAIDERNRNKRTVDVVAAQVLADTIRRYEDLGEDSIRITASTLSVLGRVEQTDEPHTLLSLAVGIDDQPVEMARRYLPFLRRMEQEMRVHLQGQPVRFELVLRKNSDPDYPKIAGGRVDFQRVGALPYVLSRKAGAVFGLVAREDQGKNGVIFVSKDVYDRGITNLDCLAGRSFAFGESNSTVSTMAKVELARAGITRARLGQVKEFDSYDPEQVARFRAASQKAGKPSHLPLVRSHRLALESVLEGKFEAGVARRQYFQNAKSRGLVEIHTFDIPPDVYVAREDLDSILARAFGQSLLALRDKQLLSDLPLQPINQFLPAMDSDYNALRGLLDRELRAFEGQLPSTKD